MLLKNYVNSFNEQINTCLPVYMQMVVQLQQGLNASKVFDIAEIVLSYTCDVNICVYNNIYSLTITTINGGMSTIKLKNNKLILDVSYVIEENNYLNYYNETDI